MMVDIIALTLLVIGAILSGIGWNKSKDLKKNRFLPVWKADGCHNRWLLGGTIFLVLGAASFVLL